MKKTRIMIILISAMAVLLTFQMSFAQDRNANGGTYSYNGSTITTEDTESIVEELSKLQPGDTIEIEFNYKNDSDEEAEWYIRNDVLKTLEKQADMNGGYAYSLTNYGKTGTTPIFDSKAVGGDYGPDGIAKGLKGATDATGQFFHIDTLSTGQSGKTVLKIGLDGESQANIYQDKDALILVQYAVETIEGSTVEKHVDGDKKSNGVKTGDDANLLIPVLLLLSSLLLLILAAWSFRKDGEDA